MKKIIALAATVAALALGACSSFEDETYTGNRPAEADGVHSFVADMGTASRAGISGTHSVWEADDEAGAICYNGATPEYIKCVARKGSLSTDRRTVVFDCASPLSPEGEQYALYPYIASAQPSDFAAGSAGAREWSVELPSQSLNAEGGFRYPLLVGVWNGSGFSFENPLVVVKVTLKKAAAISDKVLLQSIVVSGNNGEKMWGKSRIAMPAGTVTLAEDAATEAVLDCAKAELTADGTDFYICIAPQNYTKGLTFSFVTDAGVMSVPAKASGWDCTAKANHVIALPAVEFTTDTSGISVAVVRATDTTITVGWTITPANVPYIGEPMPSTKCTWTDDIAKKYKAELYADAACKHLIVGWTLNDKSKTYTNTINYSKDYPPRFIFGSLTPKTTYYLLVRNLTDGVAMQQPVAVATTARAYEGKVVATAVNKGDVILYENFEKSIWGGDLTARAAGYSRNDRSSATTLYTASGDNPDEQDPQYYTVKDTEIGLFNTLKGVVPAMGLSAWGWIADDNKTGCILARPGYLKIGASSKHAALITPQLAALSGTSTVRVTFRACPYGATSIDNAEKAIAVKVFNNTTLGSGNRITAYTEGNSAALTLEGDQTTWKEYSVVLSDVEPSSRIAFCGVKPGTGVQSRFHIDDIRISLEETQSVDLWLTGHIKDTAGNPIGGVSVTDGFSVVQTDAEGYYKLPGSRGATFVYYTVPAGYEVNYNSDGYPLFYSRISGTGKDYDFTLAPLTGGKQTKWTLCCMADPQVKSTNCISRFSAETGADLKATLPRYNNVYSIVLGDVLWNSSSSLWDNMYTAMKYNNCGAHFFAIMGNHDWYVSDDDSAPSDANFMNHFGPTRFSFDRGDVHVVGMNNVIANGKGGDCLGGFTDTEYSWLTKDLASVPKSKCVVLCCHIPFRDGDAEIYHSKYYTETLNLLAQYAKAYILVGHSHYNYHNFHTINGKEIHEITHTAACGLFWNLRVCGDGSPAGYGIYEFDGADIKNFVMKNSEYDASFQIRAYDGSESVSGQFVNPYSWAYDKGYIVANVFNADKKWKVELYQDGTKVCDMTQITASDKRTATLALTTMTTGSQSIGNNRDWWLWHQAVEAYTTRFKDRDGNKWWGRRGDDSYQKVTGHLYKGKLRTVPTNMADANFEVRATDSYGNVFKCTKLSTYSDMDAWRE